MRIFTVWGVRHSAPQEPELITAWDEYSVDANPEGFQQDWKKGVAAWGDDMSSYRHIIVEVPSRLIEESFNPPVLSAVEWSTTSP